VSRVPTRGAGRPCGAASRVPVRGTRERSAALRRLQRAHAADLMERERPSGGCPRAARPSAVPSGRLTSSCSRRFAVRRWRIGGRVCGTRGSCTGSTARTGWKSSGRRAVTIGAVTQRPGLALCPRATGGPGDRVPRYGGCSARAGSYAWPSQCPGRHGPGTGRPGRLRPTGRRSRGPVWSKSRNSTTRAIRSPSWRDDRAPS